VWRKTPLCPRRGAREVGRERLRAERHCRGGPRKIGERGNAMRTLTLAALLLATTLAVAAFTIAAGPAAAAEAEMHYAPVENLEHIDLALIKSAKKSVDVAMYTLTDWPIIAALKDALAHGVAVRIALDPSVRQAYDKLADMAGVVRVKKRGPLMHLKAYAIDGALLRTGSANLSPGGLKQQDNDLVILRDPAATAKFEARFAEIYAAAEPMRVEPPPACPVKGNVNRKGERIYHMPDF
jgi:phosphatidylserine/phosphatidylglycerophosphate/cardiolipin synthase-like enzyme